ncbi:hypothetical protein V1512DRAFT_272838 [Lipomyces arxii]|uniref:uncharacterized protein n=1 Tax=Lipomyces arxii TaxID=56418 RepID=UPI0034CD2F19
MPHMDRDEERAVLESSSSQQSSSSAVQTLEHGQTSSSPVQSPRLSDDDLSKVGVEENFFTDEEDDEIMNEVELKMETTPPRVNVPSAPVKGKQVNSELMLLFYQRLFPFKEVFHWLNHFPAPTSAFTNREIAFTLQNDVYIRYNAFANHDAMKREVLRLNPSRFEIGPVYSANPRDRKIVRKGAFKPLEKELVFDIDLTDYDEIRTCCSGTKICNLCWNFITVAIKVIDAAMRKDLGFKHIMWVYSGRRGAHAWVCDKKARMLDDQKRRAIAGYLEIIKGGAQTTKKVNLKRPLHPMLRRSLDLLKTSFSTQILSEQDPWSTPEGAEKLLRLLPDKVLNQELAKKWESSSQSSASRWADIDLLAQKGVSKSLDTKKLMEAKQDIVLEYLYPRLDAEVSKHLNHLLKSPFCIHPGTGMVCVPIDSTLLESFDPMTVPTVAQLIQEIDDWDAKHDTAEKLADFEKTSLKPYIEHFHRFVSELMKEEMKEKRKLEQEEGESLEF